MTDGQKSVVKGVVAALITLILASAAFEKANAVLPWPREDMDTRLALALISLSLPAFLLMVMVNAVGEARFMSAAIDGRTEGLAPGTDINRRVLTNSLEQLLIFAIALLGLVTWVEQAKLLAIPALCILFTFARFAFWIGYRIRPTLRAYGFALTVLPTVAMLLLNLRVIVFGDH